MAKEIKKKIYNIPEVDVKEKIYQDFARWFRSMGIKADGYKTKINAILSKHLDECTK